MPPIAGLQYIRDFIDQQKHDDLLRQIDSLPWLTDLKRRVQHYGYKYNYKSRSVNYSMRIGPLPQWAEELADILCERRLMPERPDQVIVNEYRPGQGIANHVDCVPCFTDTIGSLSLGAPCVMEFTSKETRQVLPLLLEQRSVVILQGEARFAWMHGIPARKTDQYQNKTIKRGRRVSLTFRKVILDGTEPPSGCPLPPQPAADLEGVQDNRAIGVAGGPSCQLSLVVVDGTFAVSRLANDVSTPSWATAGHLFSITRTADELSIVCSQDAVPEGIQCERGWRCLRVAGTTPFSVVGVLTSLTAPLAQAGISVFAISTFDTDYVLVKEDDFEKVLTALQQAGHPISK